MMCQKLISPNELLNQYIKETGMTTKEWATILDIPYRKLKLIRIGAEDVDLTLLTKLSMVTKTSYRTWSDCFWTHKAYIYSQAILDKFPTKFKNTINKLIGYE